MGCSGLYAVYVLLLCTRVDVELCLELAETAFVPACRSVLPGLEGRASMDKRVEESHVSFACDKAEKKN